MISNLIIRSLAGMSLIVLCACGAGKSQDGNISASSIQPVNSVSSLSSSLTVSTSSIVTSSLTNSSISMSSSSQMSSSSRSSRANSSSPVSSSSLGSSSLGSSSISSSSRSNSSSQLSSVASSRSSSVGSSGTGVWQNVTHPDLNMSPNFNSAGNYGAVSIMVDPVRPSDLYASVCYQGLWKSTDYGLTWVKINTGINADKIDAGRPAMAIDPNPNRDPATPPTIYSNSLYGGYAQGLWKSTNGGRDWTDAWVTVLASDGITDIKMAVGVDVGAPVVDPLDSQHLIMGMHGSMTHADHIFESINGGATWIDRGPVGMTNLSVFLIDRTTWIVQGDYFASGNTLKTRNSGASWEFSGVMGHAHGGASLLNIGNGELYLGGIGADNKGLYHSLNYGDSWVRIPNSTDTSAIVATPSRIYTSYGWAFFVEPISPVLGHVDRTGNTWVGIPDPQGMTNGAVNLVLTNDGSHNIILGVFYNAGIWRYVEPTDQ